MPIFDHTPPVAAGLASAGNAMQAFQQARRGREQHAASMQEQKVRIAAILAQSKAEQRDRRRQRRSDAASVMALQQRALREDAESVRTGQRAAKRGLDTAAAVAGGLIGPLASGAIKAVMQKQIDAIPPAMQSEMRRTQRLMSRMRPEDARAFMEERHADMKARTLAFEGMRLQRDIESAANRGVFGDVSGGGADGQPSPGAASAQNLMQIAQKDPVKARQMLQGLLEQHRRERERQIVRDEATEWATEEFKRAKANGTSPAGMLEAQGLLSDFEVDDNMEPGVFRSKFRAALLKPDVPMVRIFGLDKEVEDRSGWSHGGYLEDMSPRQKTELTSIARFMARQDMLEEGLADSEGDPLDPTIAVTRGLDPVELEQRTDDHLSRLFASNGWRSMGDDDFAFSRAGMPWESKNDFFDAWNAAVDGGGQIEQEKVEQASTLPSWEGTPGDVRLRVSQKINEFKAQDPDNERGQELFDLISSMGVNPETVDYEAARGMAGKTELSDEELQTELDQMRGYPLSDPKDVQRYEKELSRRQVQKGADSQNASKEAVAGLAAKASSDGFPGKIGGKSTPATLEVLRRWYERKGDQEQAAAVLRLMRAAGVEKEWSEEDLRKKYADEQKRGPVAKSAREKYDAGDAPAGARIGDM